MGSTTYQQAITQLPLLEIVFDTDIRVDEITCFRGALVKKIGIEHEWFHNHANTSADKRFHYRYPMVQYKRWKSHPMLLFLGGIIDEAQHYFSQPCWDLTINNRLHEMRIKSMQQKRVGLKVSPSQFCYQICNWQAFNQENFKTWHRMDSLVERIQKLEQLLVAHILSFAKGAGWNIEERILVTINSINGQKTRRYKNINARVFDLSFSTNVRLPEFIGLGKGASRGLGVIHQNRKKYGYGI